MSNNKNAKASILVVEDDEAILTMLRYNLEQAGYRVYTSADGDEVVDLVGEYKPDLILLDWMLPGKSGIEICQLLRKKPETRHTPIIMLSAKGEEHDRIAGLDTGADDYITKPFSPSELIARIKAVFRRIRPAFVAKELTFRDVRMDLTTYSVLRGGKDLKLGPTEFRILQYLMEQPHRVLSREQIMARVWGHDIYVELRTVDVHINRLRKALRQAGESTDIIKTIRLAGYCLQGDDDASLDTGSVLGDEE